ncbi:non-canonical purine NTP pyrophosphatase [Geotalea uraniireducens]|uniref:dITP/XTP pyrophosphatase n=1 Tax=Geotalea uraniireducens TaxID=351604 RepID=A0ABM8ELQ2_9BACT|nr:XTP/dITP diphosphatase [Geotalea uraniireducens]BDV43372.1 non-canonical purine NTP pyrophosphatase [Geotalea uraniireducens]
MTHLVIATRNKGKMREIAELLAGMEITLLSPDDFAEFPEVAEDGETFEENAVKKARSAVVATGLPSLADDSGLIVPLLGGRPGVFSARFAREGASDGENNDKLLAELTGFPLAARNASFCCVIALCFPGGECLIFRGELAGMILDQPHGNGGFGYDPLFYVADQGKTLAELPSEVKNRISHRGKALAELKKYLFSP